MVFENVVLDSKRCSDLYDDDEKDFQRRDVDCRYITHEELNKQIHNVNTNFSIIHFNSRSLVKNFDSIEALLQMNNVKCSVIGISETWMNDNYNPNDFSIPDYDVYFSNRSHKKGGGRALYINSKFNHKSFRDGTYAVEDCFEVVTAEIKQSQNKIIYVSCIYRPPNTCVDKFVSYYTEFLNKFRGETLYICGDFNIDLLKYKKQLDTTNFLGVSYSYGIYPLFAKPTRINDKSATLIDNIFTNDLSNNIKSCILIDDITDHLPVLAVVSNVSPPVDKMDCIIRRKIIENNVNKLKNMLRIKSWASLYNYTDVNECYDYFIREFIGVLDECCPITKTTIKSKGNKPWFTNGLINACRKKNLLYKNWLIKKNEVTEQRYKKYKNKLTLILKKAEKQYYRNKLENSINDIKGTWAVINEVLRRGKKGNVDCEFVLKNNNKVYDKLDIANIFNDFYINVGPNLADEINAEKVDTEYDTFLKNVDISQTMFIRPTNEYEIVQIIDSFKNKSSEDIHGLSMVLLKQVKDFIVKPLNYIFNVSLETGKFLDYMKVAKVLPLYKNNDKHNVSNYRPVSLLPQFSKILEKIFEKRLRLFVDKITCYLMVSMGSEQIDPLVLH